MTPGRILVVDDDPWIQRIVARALGQRGHQVSLAGEATGAFVVASKIKPDLILTAISLPAIEGWAWWERLRTLPACADAPIIFLLSDVDESTSISGAGARDQRLRKPFRMEDLEAGGRYSSRGRESEYPRGASDGAGRNDRRSNPRPDTGRCRRCAARSISWAWRAC